MELVQLPKTEKVDISGFLEHCKDMNEKGLLGKGLHGVIMIVMDESGGIFFTRGGNGHSWCQEIGLCHVAIDQALQHIANGGT